MNKQEETITALVKDKDVAQIQGEVRGLAREALQASFKSIQDALGVESGDNACYYLNGSDFETFEKGALAWFEYYTSREITDYLADDPKFLNAKNALEITSAFPRPTKEEIT